jgi:DNA-binding winged helix-turn-helix (wHTH) protein
LPHFPRGAPMSGEFRLGSWVVHPSLNRIERNGKTTHLEPKVVEVLVYLADHDKEVVAKEQLIQAVWGNTFVTEDVLTRCVSELRKALEDDAKEPRVIETIPKRGYRLLLEIERQNRGQASVIDPPRPHPRRKFRYWVSLNFHSLA